VTSDTPINQWSFEHVAGKLREALRNSVRPGGTSTSNTNQTALNANAGKTNTGRYSGPPCTYSGCRRPKSHATENCWTKEEDEKKKTNEKKKHKAKKAKKKEASDSSDTETGSDSESDSDQTRKKRHHANRSQAKSEKTLRVLNASVTRAHSYRGKKATSNVFLAHPDSGASNHMSHKLEFFDPASFKTLSTPIPISLGDDSEIFATGRGTIRLMFNIDGKAKEGAFSDVLYVPELKVTLLSVGQSARLPHCKVVFDGDTCEYIDKNTNKVIARAHASGENDLYTLDASPVVQKVAAKIASTTSLSVDINVLHRRLGHLGIDNCRTLVDRRLVDGIDRVVGDVEFCKGCVYGRSKRKHHPATSTKTKRRLERVHIDLCGPLPDSLGGNRYFLLIIDEHTHYQWVEFLSKKSDAFSWLRKWKLSTEHEADLKLQCLKSDGGKEFGSEAFEEWLAMDGVIHEKSAPYEHEQNGLAERAIRNVSQQAMCQLFGADMSRGFWPYTVETAVYLINRSPTTTLKDMTPFEAWTGKRPNIGRLHTFGETGYVHIPPETRRKWTKKSRPCRFLGYIPRSRNYKLWDPDRHMVTISPNVDFDESSVAHPLATSKEELDDLEGALGDREHVERVAGSDVKADNYRDDHEWESDDEILRPRATKDEEVPNGPDPVVPLIPREPGTAPRRHHRSEIERLADTAGPPPIHARRRPIAAIGSVGRYSVDNNHCASRREKETDEKERRSAYYEALLAAESTCINNEPTDEHEARGRPDWPKWEAAMQEELNSLERHGTYE
jgi:hypothetical protein